MKNFKIFILLTAFSAVFTSCEEGDVFTGSPLDDSGQVLANVDIVISTTASMALTNQNIPFTVTLVNKTFTDTLNVEATALSKGGRRRRGYVEILPNQTTATGEILAAGGDIYNSTFTLAATAVELYTVELGKHYLVSSNVLNVNTGDTTVPTDDSSKLQVKLAWPDASVSSNNLRLTIDRPDPLTNGQGSVQNTPQGLTKLFNLQVNNTYPVGEYIILINASKLRSTPNPTDMPYRIVLNFPDSHVEVFEGVYQNLYADDPATPLPVNEESPLLPVVKIIKSIVDGDVVFTAQQL